MQLFIKFSDNSTNNCLQYFASLENFSIFISVPRLKIEQGRK